MTSLHLLSDRALVVELAAVLTDGFGPAGLSLEWLLDAAEDHKGAIWTW